MDITFKLDQPAKINNFSTLPMREGGLLRTIKFEPLAFTREDLFSDIYFEAGSKYYTKGREFALNRRQYLPLLKIRVESLLPQKQVDLIRKFPTHVKLLDTYSRDRWGFERQKSFKFGIHKENYKSFKIDKQQIDLVIPTTNARDPKSDWVTNSNSSCEYETRFSGLSEDGYIEYIWGVQKCKLFDIEITPFSQDESYVKDDLKTEIIAQLLKQEMYCDVYYQRHTNLLHEPEEMNRF